MNAEITVSQLEIWLGDGKELAIFDVREHGEYGEGHLFLAVPLPYSRLEPEIARLAPAPQARVVVYDDGHSGVSKRAVTHLKQLGYQHVFALAGGTQAWSQAGYSLFEGVNVPSKTFGEHIEAIRHTPRLTPQALQARLNSHAPLVILDGRPYSEYQKMSIPGSICCPNGELSTRIDQLVKDELTPVVVNCAGRTRSIVGAQTLIDLGIKNPVYALENGTQGWMLADLPLEHGQTRRYPEETAVPDERVCRARAMAERSGATRVSPEEVKRWMAEQRTVYLLDVRSEAEFSAGSLPGAQHAPGGQLQQATDHYVGVRNACLVLLDSENVRAPVTAYWLRQMGHRAYILQGGIEAGLRAGLELTSDTPAAPRLPEIDISILRDWMAMGRQFQLWDIRSSQCYRDGHIPGSEWQIRPRLPQHVQSDIVIVSDDAQQAGWLSLDLNGENRIWLLKGGVEAWRAAGGVVEVSPDSPPDEQRIDYLFFTHDRHQGNKAAARQYLKWEQGLWARLQPSERQLFSQLEYEKSAE